MTATEIKELKVAKVMCLQSLLFSTRYFYFQLNKRLFTVRPHHERIADVLELVFRGQIRNLIINIPPRYGKTEIAVKHFIAHGLAISHGRAKFIHLSASDTLALDNSEGAMEIVKSESYQRMYPEVRIKKSSDSKKKWYTTAGGGVYATAAGGQVTGFGAGTVEEEKDGEYIEFEEILNEIEQKIEQKEGFGGAIVIDDAIKPDDTDSDVKRERVNDRYHSTIKNRGNSRRTPIINIQQRLHPMDLSGHLIKTEKTIDEGGKWFVLTLPALYFEDDQWKALWPAKHTVEDLREMEITDPINFQRQYQQNPKPKEGILFPEEELQYYNPDTVNLEKLTEYRFGFLDPADEGSDDLSFPAGYLVGNKIYVPDVVYNKQGTDVNEPKCVEFIKSHLLNACEIESNSAWTLFRKNIKRAIEEDGSDCDIRSRKSTTNKHVRILEASAFIRNHFIFRSDWRTCSPEYRRFFENLTSYMAIQSASSRNKHDDAPDSCAGMAKFFRTQFSHLWRIVTERQG